MLRGPSWRRLLPDVYLHRDSRLDHRTWCEAVALVLPLGSAIGLLSAAYLWSVNLLPTGAPVHAVIPRAARVRRHPAVSVTRTQLFPDEITRFGGLPVTTPLRTAFDLGRRPPLEDAVIAVDALTHRRLVSLDDLAKCAAGRPRWTGNRQLASVLSLAEPLTESPMETRLRLILIQAGLPRPVAQHEVRDGLGRFVARLDLAYASWRLGLEYEGDHHRDRAVFRHDLARVNALRALGWTVLRFTADDVLRHPGRIVQQVLAVVRAG